MSEVSELIVAYVVLFFFFKAEGGIRDVAVTGVQTFALPICTRGARRVAVLASRSRDGEIVSRYVARFGLATIRGSSSRGGAGALRQLVATVRAGEDVAVVPDGPRGPRRQLQPGVVTLAALTGAPIVPLAFAARPARRLASWDEQLVPWPFARSVLVLGETIAVPRDADRERTVKEVERALNDTTADADRLVAP